ncbi:hypothetical protein BJY04DRAFT_212848 [Aspergillus karnatakaensis]|uniref:uncharacterized protein n=1 Tax=Aspergillus karnatakaensis TaxID=1810916 RepID=UPI003CCE466A
MGEIGEFYRDPPLRRCWDWVIVSGNCHYAKNRSSFKDYRGVGKHVSTGFPTASSLLVLGVGTVELQVATGRLPGSPARPLVLENVLHIPDAVYNGFSMIVDAHRNGGVVGNWSQGPDGMDEERRPRWCGQRYHGLSKLVIAGNPRGETYDPNGAILSLSLNVDEQDLREICGV